MPLLTTDRANHELYCVDCALMFLFETGNALPVNPKQANEICQRTKCPNDNQNERYLHRLKYVWPVGGGV